MTCLLLLSHIQVLDVGCGIGGPARAIARFSDANVTGITLNQFQCDRAKKYTKQQKLDNQVNFVQGDFMKLSEKFAEGSFDAVYAIEATVHAPTFEGIYSEIFKVLKPGGVAGIYEWVMTDKWDPTNPEHKKIAHGIEVGDGIAEMRTRKQAHDAFISAGFEILVEDDLADRGDEVDWYYPLEGDLRKAQTPYDLLTCFRTSKMGQLITHNALWAMEKVGLVPKGTHDVGETLRVAATHLVAGGQQKREFTVACSLPCQTANVWLTVSRYFTFSVHADAAVPRQEASVDALALLLRCIIDGDGGRTLSSSRPAFSPFTFSSFGHTSFHVDYPLVCFPCRCLVVMLHSFRWLPLPVASEEPLAGRLGSSLGSRQSGTARLVAMLTVELALFGTSFALDGPLVGEEGAGGSGSTG